MYRQFNIILSMILLAIFDPVLSSAKSIDPVYVSSNDGEEGNGARFLVGNNCITVTAYHVVRNTSLAIVTPIRSPKVDATVFETNKNIDIALLKENLDASVNNCPVMPTGASMEAALLDDSREVWYVGANGDARPFRVDLLEYSGTSLRLQIRGDSIDSSAPRAFIPGMSGALVVFGGVPVAILLSSHANAPIAEARLLDDIKRHFGKSLDLQASVVTAAPREPYDLEQLPPEYRRIVKGARENKRRAELAAQAALEVRRKADDARSIALQYQKREVIRGHAHFDVDDPANYYAGEVYKVGVRIGAQGYGVLVLGPGDSGENAGSIGETYYCRFVRGKNCTGLGVVEYAVNGSNDMESWAGGLKGTQRAGLGHLRWRTTENGSLQAWLHSPDKIVLGVWEMIDGRRFEGEIGANWDGKGVLWSKDGSLIRYGRWESGQVRD